MARGKYLKLYVWEGAGILEDYTTGIVAVMAYDKKQALELIKKEDDCVWRDCKDKKPDVYRTPTAVYCYGGG